MDVCIAGGQHNGNDAMSSMHRDGRIFCNAMNVNEGKEVEIVIAALSERYHVHADICRVADYSDCSNRRRLMIICFHQDIGDIGAEFEFPKPFYDEKHYYTAEGTAMKSGLGTSPKYFFIISPCYQVQHGGYN